MHKKAIGIFIILCMLMDHMVYADFSADKGSNNAELDHMIEDVVVKETGVSLIRAPERGVLYYYAQNDSKWSNLLYSHKTLSHRRTFGEGGCVPTALAIVLANLLSPDELMRLDELTKRGYYINGKTLSHSLISAKAEKIYLKTPEEYLQYLPLIIGSYAAGNNIKNQIYIKERGGTSHFFYKILVDFFDLQMASTMESQKALSAIETGGYVITSSGGVASPFTVSGHYFVLVSYDDDYIYLFDPYIRSSYERDRKAVLDIVEDGLVRFRRNDIDKVHLNRMFIFHNDSK